MNIKKIILAGLMVLLASSCSNYSNSELSKSTISDGNLLATDVDSKKEINVESTVNSSEVSYVQKENVTYSVQEELTPSKNNNKSNTTRSGETDIDTGLLLVDMPKNIYSNYPAKEIKYSFSKTEYASEVTYLVSDSRLVIENNKMYATGDFEKPIDVIVKVMSEHCDPVIKKVTVSTYNPVSNFETRMKFYEQNLIKEENKGGTIFVGDSYFDGYPKSKPPFWSDFYTDYQNEDKIFLMGASSSQIEQLEVSAERIVYPMEPKEIVMHIGFNDVHSGYLPVKDLYSRIVNLVEEYRENLPNVKVYFIGVEPKKNGYTLGNKFYNSSTIRATALTSMIKEYATATEWFTYVDTMDIFVDENGVIKSDSYLESDNSHPTLAAYDLIRERINAARGVTNNVVDNSKFSITNLDGSLGINSSGRQLTSSSGTELTNNYVVKGKLEIKQFNLSNAHLQFRFSQASRFLLWDSNSDGKFGVGYMSTGLTNKSDKTEGATIYDANNGLELNWAIVVNNGAAYFVINNVVIETLTSPTLEYFNIGALQMNVDFTNVEVVEKGVNEANYNSLLQTYSIN